MSSSSSSSSPPSSTPRSDYAFELLSRSCVTADEYFLDTLYVGFATIAIACVAVELVRIAWKRWRQKLITSIGRLVEYLVIVQGGSVGWTHGVAWSGLRWMACRVDQTNPSTHPHQARAT